MGTVDGYLVPYGDIVAYLNGGLLLERVEHRAILDIAVFANGYGVDIPTEHGVEPKCGAFADRDIAHHGGVLHHDNIVRNAGSKHLPIAVDSLDKCHSQKLQLTINN